MRFIGMRRADPFISSQAENPTPPSHCILPAVNQPSKPIQYCPELCTDCPQLFIGPCLIQIFSSTSLMHPAKRIYNLLQPLSVELVVGYTAKSVLGGRLRHMLPACWTAHSVRFNADLFLSTHDRLFNVVSGIRLSHCSHFSIGQCLLHFRYRD